MSGVNQLRYHAHVFCATGECLELEPKAHADGSSDNLHIKYTPAYRWGRRPMCRGAPCTPPPTQLL
eukprot:8486709-Karenia_brevis.AAC.1